MSENNTSINHLSAEDIAMIGNAIEKLEEILFPKMAVINAVINGEIPGMDIRRQSTFEEIRKALDQLKEIKKEMAKITNEVGDQRLFTLNRAYQKALAYFHEVEDAARKNVPGAQEIYNDLKQYLPDE